jgi:hypothetical protein
VRDVEHRDRFGRRWNVSTFAVPYLDMHVVVMLLPTPRGYAGILAFAPRNLLAVTTDQLLFVSDYFYVTYAGTLPQWRAFLDGPRRPEALAAVKLACDGTGLHYRSSHLDFDVPAALLKLDDTSTVQLRMSYSLPNGALGWDVGAVFVSNEQKDPRYFSLTRQPRPSDEAGKKQKDRWSEMIDSRGAFSPGRGHDDDYKKLWRRAAIGADYKPGAKVDPKATLLYEVASTVQGAKMPRDIDDMHDLLLENVHVKER